MVVTEAVRVSVLVHTRISIEEKSNYYLCYDFRMVIPVTCHVLLSSLSSWLCKLADKTVAKGVSNITCMDRYLYILDIYFCLLTNCTIHMCYSYILLIVMKSYTTGFKDSPCFSFYEVSCAWWMWDRLGLWIRICTSLLVVLCLRHHTINMIISS
jgi:hypothetical protein